MVEEEGAGLERQLDAVRRDLDAAAAALRRSPFTAERRAAQERLRAAAFRLGRMGALPEGSWSATPPQGGTLHRRLLLRMLAKTDAGGVSTGAGDRLAELDALLARGGPIDDPLLSAFRFITGAYLRAYRVGSPGDLVDGLRTHVNRTASYLDIAATPALRAGLGSLVGMTACLTGWVLHVTGHRGEAHAYFTFGRDAARDADDVAGQALAIGSMASLFTPLNRGAPGGSRIAGRLLEQAVTLVPATVPPGARAWLLGRLAEEWAALGDTAGFGRALDRCWEVFAEQPAGDDATPVFSAEGVLSFWGPGGPGPGLVEAFGLGVLGDERGVGLLQPAVAAELRPVARTNLLGDLATAHLHRGEAEQAAHTLTELVDVALAGDVRGRIDRARGLRQQLPDDLPATAVLDDRLRTAATTT